PNVRLQRLEQDGGDPGAGQRDDVGHDRAPISRWLYLAPRSGSDDDAPGRQGHPLDVLAHRRRLTQEVEVEDPVNLQPRFPPVAEADVQEFEQATGLQLVPSYRDFLLANNGGRPDDNVVDVPGLGEAAVNDFLGLKDGDPYDLRHELEVYDGRIPQ